MKKYVLVALIIAVASCMLFAAQADRPVPHKERTVTVYQDVKIADKIPLRSMRDHQPRPACSFPQSHASTVGLSMSHIRISPNAGKMCVCICVLYLFCVANPS